MSAHDDMSLRPRPGETAEQVIERVTRATSAVTHAISGELHGELLHGTSLDDGTSDSATWGYGSSRAVDIEVHAMVRAGVRRRSGFGYRVTMSGSLDAWRAISAYARDRGQMEQTLSGDFNPGLGARLIKQSERLDAFVNTHTKEST